MEKHKYIFLIVCINMLSFTAWTQSYNKQQIQLAEQLESLSKNVAPELAYIQTSKDIYETGEDLWFKVYLLDAKYLIPSVLSNTLYLQLINETNKKVVWQEKYEIQDGFANGRVYLASTLAEGDYILEAFTPNSFFNNTTEFKAVRRIKIVTDITSQKSDSVKIEKPIINKNGSIKSNSIQFNTFPEGGDLVSGILSRLAFKAVNKEGEPVDIAGNLFEDSTKLLEFKSIHAGMGSFDFIPDAGKKYMIKLTKPAIENSFLLPDISRVGMTMKLIDRNKESLSFKLSQSSGFEENDFYLRVQCRGIVYGMTTGKLKKELIVKIPLELLPQGIAEVTLFNSNSIPVAERLVFVNQDRRLIINTKLSKEIYSTREKVTLQISAKDENGKPVIANLGVSVFDKLYQNPRDSNNILAHFYLSTQLKGRIYNPSFYFKRSNKDRDEALDLLMLTQGWRKYVWNEENLKKNRDPHQQIIYDGIIGKLSTPIKRKKIPMEQAFVIVSSPNIDERTVMVLTDSVGEFIVPSDYLKLWKDDYVYLKPPFSSKFKPDIKLTDPFKTINHIMSSNELTYPIPRLIINKEATQFIPILRPNVVRIKEVTIKGKNTNTIHGKFMGKLDTLAKMNSDYVCRFNILNCKNHPNEVDNKKPVVGGLYLVQSPKGALHLEVYHYSVNSYKSFSEEDLLKLYHLTRVKAYYGDREFYSPDYDKEKAENNLPDFRNTLLWEPTAITDDKGEASLSFFCSDINTDFVGRIEGVGGDGLLGTGGFNFKVRILLPTP